MNRIMLPQMELRTNRAATAVPPTWILAQTNGKVIDGWQSLGIASRRPAAAKLAASGYAAAAKAGQRPWGERLVVSGSLKALDQPHRW